jgi:hypothetical protein
MKARWIQVRRWLCRRRLIHNSIRQASTLYGWYCPRCDQARAESYRRSMERWLLIAGILAIAVMGILTTAAAQELPERHDGIWWRSQAPEFKRAYLLGALDHAAPLMAPDVGLGAQWIGPDVGQVVDRLDAFYALEDNRTATVQEILPLMLAWLAAGPSSTLQDALRQLAAEAR